jgi:hypothetical protein
VSTTLRQPFADNYPAFPHNKENGRNPAVKGETRMTETTQASPAPTTIAKDDSEPENPSLVECIDDYMRAYKRAKRQGKDDESALESADKAYCLAIPLLTSNENVRDFVACVAHGMLRGSISGSAGARLLYAAQVAAGIRTQPAPPKPAE